MYQGYDIKIGNTILPEKFIKIDSYDASYPALDLDAFRDANSTLHRNVIGRKLKVEFQTPYMYQSDLTELMTLITSNFLTALEQDLMITCYYKLTDSYITQRCYLVDPNFKIAQNSRWGKIYSPTRICFIAY